MSSLSGRVPNQGRISKQIVIPHNFPLIYQPLNSVQSVLN